MLFILNLFRQYHYKIYVFLLAVSIILFPMGINIQIPLNILYLCGILFLAYHYKDLSFKELRPLKIFIFCFLGVLILAYISVFFGSKNSFIPSDIKTFLIIPFLIMIWTFFIFKRLPKQDFTFFLILFFIALIFHSLATIYDYMQNFHLGYRASGFNNLGLIVYGFILLMGFGFGLAFLLTTKYKLLGLVLFIISLLSLIANNTRLFFVAIPLMIIFAFIIKYPYKKTIFSCIAILIVLFVSVYEFSGHLDDRYNFKKMLNHFNQVWIKYPSEMGTFDKTCFEVDFKMCSDYSLKLGLNKSFQWEHSSLYRISAAKSTLKAILENPFRPNGYSNLKFYLNLEKIFPLNSINYPYVIQISSSTTNPYSHPHNTYLLYLFDLGIFGFILIGIFGLNLLRLAIKSYKATTENTYKIFLYGFSIFLVGLMVSMFFDVLIWRENQTMIFILFGITLGLVYKDKE